MEARVTKLEKLLEEHKHDNLNSIKIKLSDLIGFIEVVDTVPTEKPTSVFGQIKLHQTFSVWTLYIYDYKYDAWKSVGLT